MKNRTVIVVMLINFLLSVTILQGIRINGVLANTTIILVVSFAIIYGSREGFVAAITAGILQDLFVSKIIGINLICYVVIAVAIGLFDESLFKDNVLTPIVMFVLSTFSYHIIFYFFMFFFSDTLTIDYLIPVVLTEVVYNTVLGVIMYGVILRRTHGYGLR